MVACIMLTSDASARKWTDSTGDRTVEAEFLDFRDGKVHLKREDGKVFASPIERFSEADQRWVKENYAKRVNSAEQGKASPETPTQGAAGWSVGPATLAWLKGDYEDQSLPLGGGIVGDPYTVKASTGCRLAVVKCQITALLGDPAGPNRLSTTWKKAYEALASAPENSPQRLGKLFLPKELSAEDVEKLKQTGEHRLFDMREATLAGTGGKQFEPVWSLGSHGGFTLLFLPKGHVETLQMPSEKSPTKEWNWVMRVNGHQALGGKPLFVGLLQVRCPVEVSFLYDLPRDIDVQDFTLTVGGSRPARVEVLP